MRQGGPWARTAPPAPHRNRAEDRKGPQLPVWRDKGGRRFRPDLHRQGDVLRESGGNQGVLPPALPAPACRRPVCAAHPGHGGYLPPGDGQLPQRGQYAPGGGRYPAHRPCAGLFRGKRHRLYGDGVPPWGHLEELDGPAPRRGAPLLPVEGPSPDEKPGAAPPGRCHPPGHRPGQHHADAGRLFGAAGFRLCPFHGGQQIHDRGAEARVCPSGAVPDPGPRPLDRYLRPVRHSVLLPYRRRPACRAGTAGRCL